MRWASNLVAFLLVAFQGGSHRPVSAQDLPDPSPACKEGAPIADMAQALETVVAGFQANYRKLHTWQGKFEIISSSDWSGEGIDVVSKLAGDAANLKGQSSAELVRHYGGEFAIDFDNDRLFTTHELVSPTKVTPGNGGASSTMPDRLSDRSLVTKDSYIHFDPEFSHTAPFMGLEDWRVTEGPVAFRDPIEQAAREEYGAVTDPRKFFWTRGHMETFGDYLAPWIDRLRSSKTPARIKDSFTGTTAVYQGETTYCLTIAGHQQFVIDSGAGYNVRLFRQFEPGMSKLISTRQIEYIEQDGVFVPTHVEMVAYHPDGRVRMGYDWTLKESSVNKRIDGKVFSYQQLGLKDEDRVIDRVDNVAYIYSNGKLTEPKEFDIDVPSPPLPDGAVEGAGWRRNIITANLVLLGLLFFFIALRLGLGSKTKS